MPASQSSRTSAIAVDHVSVAFGGVGSPQRRNVVVDVSMQVEKGEFVSLIGPSGCGKTTLINAIAGFVEPASGNIRIGDAPVRGIPWQRVSMMFARDTLLPWRTALGNVELALELGRIDAPAKSGTELLELVGLKGFADYYPSQLSQGMRQRVALARTLAANRDVVLLDEPFAALDAQTKTLIHAEFMRIWEANRKTVILVTHDLMEAIALSDRVMVMSPHPGRLKAEYVIDLPRPRVIVDLPSNLRFLEFYRQLWDDLKSELPGFGGDVH